jgi:hypothetical protein
MARARQRFDRARRQHGLDLTEDAIDVLSLRVLG